MKKNQAVSLVVKPSSDSAMATASAPTKIAMVGHSRSAWRPNE